MSGLQIADNAIGAVLTLDGWLTMAKPLEAEVLAAAEEMFALRDPQILEVDRRPIAFFPIVDMERTLIKASASSFLSAVRRRSDADRRGYMLAQVHKDFLDPEAIEKPFPFRND